jgi:ADP-ribose pyrophosphatase
MAMRTTRPRRLGRRVLYKGRVIRIEIDRVRLPNGRTTRLEVVRHRGSVVLLPQPSPGRIILIRQFRYVIDKWIWELPAGSLEPGERPADCARRECEEEIGLTPRRISKMASYFPTPGFCDERMLFYRCQELRVPKRPIERDPDEQIEPRTFTLDEAWTLVEQGKIVDMKTVLGLGLVSPRGPGAQRVRRRVLGAGS